MGGAAVSTGWYSGNAAEDGRERRGWLLGHFIDLADGVRSSKDVEVKWGIHPAGEKRPSGPPMTSERPWYFSSAEASGLTSPKAA
jgi:hypothetical protein